jgi:hypothetical protein
MEVLPMKKIIAVLTAAFMFGTFTFAEGYISANDLEKGVFSEEKHEEDGFVLYATPEKPMEVKKHDANTVGDETFTQVISTKGSGSSKKMERIITFPVKAGETIKIACQNSGKTGSRPLHVVNAETHEEIKTISAISYTEGVTTDSVKVSAAGTYGVYSTSGGIYIFKIEVVK